MKSLVFLLLVTQAFSFPSATDVSESGRGVFDMLLGTASRICLCRCGFPNREMRSAKDALIPAVDIPEDVTNVSESKIIETTTTKEDNTSSSSSSSSSSTTTTTESTVDDYDEKGDSKLIGGDVPPTHSFPWLVLVLLKGKVVAGGALITDKHIITSASPLATAVAYDVKARIAVHDQCVGDVTSSNVSVEAIVLHPAYSPASRAHDLAMLRLSSLLRFDRRLHPICLPNSRPTFSEVATVISWLSPEGDSNTPSCEPRRVRQPILPDDDCSRAVTSPHLLTTDKSCIGVFGSKTVLCAGDVGSPVQYLNNGGRYELLGILTDVNVCDQPTQTIGTQRSISATKNATLFIRIYDHINWIRDTTASDCTCRL